MVLEVCKYAIRDEPKFKVKAGKLFILNKADLAYGRGNPKQKGGFVFIDMGVWQVYRSTPGNPDCEVETRL